MGAAVADAGAFGKVFNQANAGVETENGFDFGAAEDGVGIRSDSELE